MNLKTNLKLNFVDFWPGFDKEDNLFTKLLRPYYNITISDNPEFLIFSCFGIEYLNYKCPRLFYTGENRVTPKYAADYSITFEIKDDKKQYYFPYLAYNLLLYGGSNQLLHIIDNEEAQQLWREKEEFCCTVVSNPLGEKRNTFFELLSRRKKVASGGRHLNNVGGVVENKYEFIEKYKFVFAFENQAHPGYVTEKLTDALTSKGIPIYYGDPLVGTIFNKRRFLSLEDFPSMDALADRVINLNNDREKYIAMLCEPIFKENKLPDFFDQDKLASFLKECINGSKDVMPIAQTYKRHIHNFWLFAKKAIRKISFLREVIPTHYR